MVDKKDFKNYIKQLQDDGFAVIEGFLSQEELINMTNDYDLLLTSYETINGVKKRDYSKGEAVIVTTDNLPDHLFVKDYLKKDFFKSIVKIYLNDTIVPNKTFFCVKDIKGIKHLAQDMHFDVQRTLKFFFYLNDVNELNGAFKCVPGSHKYVRKYREKKRDRINYDNRDLTRISKFNNNAISLNGNAGDLIIFDTDVLHAAGKVTEGERRVLRSQSSPYNFDFPPKLFEKISFKLKQIIKTK